MNQSNPSNPLLQSWPGPMGGVPPLSEVNPKTLKEALEESLLQAQNELKKLIELDTCGNFEDSVLALDNLAESLNHTRALYTNWSSSFSSPELRSLRREFEPRLAAYHNSIYSHQGLYKRVLQVQQDKTLDATQSRLTQRLIEQFKAAGAHLNDETRAKVNQINQKLSRLFAEFSDRVLADEEDFVTWINEDELNGLSPSWTSSAKEAAKQHGKPALWAVQNTRSAVEPFLTLSPHRALREKVWRVFYGRGELRSETNTLSIAQEILILRAQRAQCLGYSSQAHQVLTRNMAGTPEAAMDLLKKVWEPAVRTFKKELQAMSEFAQQEGLMSQLEPWDVRYYAEKVRQRDYELDPQLISQYFSLNRLREGMFWAAKECFGWQISDSEQDSPHPDISVWDIHDANNEEIGLFYFDPYARSGKRSGAWMSVYRPQLWDHTQGKRIPPLVLNTCNFLKAGEGQASSLSLNDARTLFHEFGHAMHGLASQSKYRSLAGTNVVRDFVEFPSQLNEHWLTSSELRARFCTHAESGEALPEDLVGKMEAAANAGSGFATLEYLASAIVDLSLHLAGTDVELQGFESKILDQWGLPSQVVMRHRTPQFSHIFSGEGYASGYYCYLWADTLVADMSELFKEKGFYDSHLCQQYYDLILSQGDSIDSAEAFRQLRGRDPKVEALLRDRGLA